MAGLNATRILHVADEQHSFASYKYAKRLNRALEKAGYHSKVLSNGLKEASEAIKLFKPHLIHVHYHPNARKLRRAMLAADEQGIPWVVTYHEVERTALNRQGHMLKCLRRTPFAIFLCERDKAFALKQNPQLSSRCKVLHQPSPYKLSKEWLAQKREWLKESLWQEPLNILHCGTISPETGIENLLDISATLPADSRMVIAGTIVAGHGKYAKFLKAEAEQRGLPIDWKISKRELGKRQLLALLENVAFAYMPFGNIHAADYSGATLHSRLIPLCNHALVRVLTHQGAHSAADVALAVRFMDKPSDITGVLEEYRAQPHELSVQLDENHTAASMLHWRTCAKEMAALYSVHIKKKQQRLA